MPLVLMRLNENRRQSCYLFAFPRRASLSASADLLLWHHFLSRFRFPVLKNLAFWLLFQRPEGPGCSSADICPHCRCVRDDSRLAFWAASHEIRTLWEKPVPWRTFERGPAVHVRARLRVFHRSFRCCQVLRAPTCWVLLELHFLPC